MIIIAGITKSRVIGNGNSLPWHIPEDLANFKRITEGSTLIMGWNTFLSLKKPLPNRNNIVLSTEPRKAAGIDVCLSIPEAIEKAKSYRKEIFIIGGASIYKQFMPLADKMYLSVMKKEYAGNVYFPAWNENEWAEDVPKRKDFADFVFKVFVKKKTQ